jgi:Peptidase M50B-like
MASARISAVDRLHQVLLVGSTILVSWLGMQAVHESGHMLGAWLTGARVERVVLHPLTISRTDLAENPRPLLVAWAGPSMGVLVPLLLWAIAAAVRLSAAFLFHFFAGFCLIANGLYIGLGSFGHIGDCREMLLHGSQLWQLWLFGLVTAPLGVFLWHGLGNPFGLRSSPRSVSRSTAYIALGALIVLVILGLVV